MIPPCGLERRHALLVTLCAVLGCSADARPALKVEFIYAGTWNNIEAPRGLGFSRGLYGWRLNPADGSTVAIGLVAETVLSIDSVAKSPNGRTLYVADYDGCICTRSWPFPGSPRPRISAYRVDSNSGNLKLLGSVDSLGSMTAQISTDSSGRTLAAANYFSGNVTTFRLEKGGGFKGMVSNIRHKGSPLHIPTNAHPHGLAFSPDGRWLYVADQGLDRVYTYHFNPLTSAITSANQQFVQFPANSGPRHLAVSANSKWLYVVTEQSGEVSLLRRAVDGSLRIAQTLPIIPGNTTLKLGGAEAKISPDGRFLYVSHRPNENMAVFLVNPIDGTLRLIEFDPTSARETAPSNTQGLNLSWQQKSLWEKVETGARAFDWNSSSRWLVSANLGENAIVVLQRDPVTGQIAKTSRAIGVPQPAVVTVVDPR